MKKLILSAAFLAIGTFAMAQQEKRMDKMDPAQMEQKREERLKMMKTELNLSDSQVAQIKALQDNRIAERKENELQKQVERKAKMEAKREEHDSKMKQILTPEQYTKWEAKKKEKMEDRTEKMDRRHMKKMHKKH